MRKEDLIYFFAMSLFQKRKDRKITNSELLNDIKYFFGNKTTAENEAKDYLYQLVETDNITNAANCILNSSIPHFYNTDHSIIFHKRFINDIPLLLRLYVGCATILYGGLDEIDLVKIHFKSGKVSFMGYDEFYDSLLPTLRERIKVNLWNQKVDYFDYIIEDKRPILFDSSVFLSKDHENFKKKQSFEKRLKSIIPHINQNINLNKEALDELLRECGYELKGSKFFKI